MRMQMLICCAQPHLVSGLTANGSVVYFPHTDPLASSTNAAAQSLLFVNVFRSGLLHVARTFLLTVRTKDMAIFHLQLALAVSYT